ncbi:carbohydrate ABC transporter permease [Isoptericola sediminis]|uniref:Sugar ABC transporter permease n=1 Tax=Isoptericola sediminis TaxID=2733572 RepID=A0A849K792_9MICO|nr:sugar ABC transporter permease [Isoptericola sediminis]NNU27635.1 sugar ABC transporter permease [Isoptericola sediminis]
MSTPAPAAARAAAAAPPQRRPRHQSRYLFLLPALVFLALFSLFPLVQLLRMSLSDVTASTLNSSWLFVGLENFQEGLASGQTGDALVRTAVFVLVVTVIGMVGGFAGAVALRTRGRWSNVLLAVMVFAWALPPVVNGSVWKFLLADAGLLNVVARAVGLTDTALPFLYDQHWALGAVAFVNSWAVIPFNALVFRAALLNIEPEVFEAAALDGAGRWQEVRHIMVPSVRPTMLVLLVLTIVYGFRSFDFIYVMTYGGPGTATNTLPFLGYLQAFSQFNFGLGASTSVVAVLVVLVLAVLYARSIRKEEKE